MKQIMQRRAVTTRTPWGKAQDAYTLAPTHERYDARRGGRYVIDESVDLPWKEV